MPFLPPKIRALSALPAILLPLCCGGGDADGGLRLLDAWVRPMAVEVEEGGSLSRANSAVYLMVRNPGSGPDRLLGGETPVAAAVEVHESFLEGDVMRMREVATVEIPPGGDLEFKPGGLHLMLLDLRQALNVGDTISLTLTFQESGSMLLRVPVQTMGGM